MKAAAAASFYTALLLFGLGISHAGTIAKQTASLPDIPAPSGGEAAWIARAMRLNGVPMTIKSFVSSTNADEVLHEYERKLRTSSNMQTRRTQEGAWHVLAVMSNRYFATIRARNTVHGTEGTITVTSALENARARKYTRFPHPDSAEVVSVQEYEDEGIEAEHISFVSRRSAAIEAREFALNLEQQGWQLLRNEPSASGRNAHVVEAQKAAALAFIHLRRAETGGSTTILVVWRKA